MWLLQVTAQDLCQRQRLLIQLAEPLLRCHLDRHSSLTCEMGTYDHSVEDFQWSLSSA